MLFLHNMSWPYLISMYSVVVRTAHNTEELYIELGTMIATNDFAPVLEVVLGLPMSQVPALSDGGVVSLPTAVGNGGEYHPFTH